MDGMKQKRRNMTLLFRGEENQPNSSNLFLIHNDKQTVVDLMDELDFDERMLLIQQIMNSEPVHNSLQLLNINAVPSKSLFGNPIIQTINNYSARRFKMEIHARVKQEKRNQADKSMAILNEDSYFGEQYQRSQTNLMD